ncbi:hypothetical protein BDV96DRAFT_583146 [Lophiotrema nucula]|uniref:Uncharacterized protein n=1 Tax=Lophiotrema nucula TaxID=690887 RepID=A0A6A5YUY5_9PLEO|nr:hypothetical protein BDV96DRAFT_583146 [Lophiotrema nucula]
MDTWSNSTADGEFEMEDDMPPLVADTNGRSPDSTAVGDFELEDDVDVDGMFDQTMSAMDAEIFPISIWTPINADIGYPLERTRHHSGAERPHAAQSLQNLEDSMDAESTTEQAKVDRGRTREPMTMQASKPEQKTASQKASSKFWTSNMEERMKKKGG